MFIQTTTIMSTIRLTLFVLLAGWIFVSCKDRSAEKKIAELEARLAQIEGSKMTSTPQTPAPVAEQAPAADQKPEGPLPVIEFEKVEHDFGTVLEGQKVAYTYKFKNTGQAPLIIQSAQPSCGCTAPDWTRNPVPVGGTGFVKAEFDTKGKIGANAKTITVTANTWPKTTTLRFKAAVNAIGQSAGPVK
jgi:hypothetical protein